jgi:uncharacterized protein
MQETMKEKITKLADLQSIDSKLVGIDKSKGNLPFLVEELKKEIGFLTVDIAEFDKEKTELENSLKESKTVIESSKILLEKYKNQRNLVTNNREYEALIKEIDFRENLVAEEEKNSRSLAERITELKESLEQKNKFFEDKSRMLIEKQNLLEQKLSETQELEKELKEKRNLLVAKIDKHLYNLYWRIYGSKGQVAVVPASEGHCGGCYTILPSQKLSELKRADRIVQCDACSRILVYEIKDVH